MTTFTSSSAMLNWASHVLTGPCTAIVEVDAGEDLYDGYELRPVDGGIGYTWVGEFTQRTVAEQEGWQTA